MLVLHKLVVSTSLLPALRALQLYRRAREERPRARALAEALVPALGLAGLAALRVQRFAPTLGDITVMMLGPEGQEPAAVLKLARSEAAAAGLRRYRSALEALRRDPRLPASWRALLPQPLGSGEVGGRVYLMETMVRGAPLASAAGGPDLRDAQRAAAVVIRQLHEATVEAVAVDGRVRERLVDDRLGVVRRALARRPQASRFEAPLARLARELHEALGGGPVGLSWVHGDFAPDNILAAAGGAPITGVIDWELAAPHDLPALDLAHLLLSSRLKLGGGELGPLVDDVLHGAGWPAHEAALLDEAAAGLPGRRLGLRAITLLCWLRHVSDTLCKAGRYADSRFWLSANVEYVLARI